jgi:hypothetical protein
VSGLLDNFSVQHIAKETGLPPFDAYQWRIACGTKYEDDLPTTIRTIRLYLAAGVPRTYVEELSSAWKGTLHPVEGARGIRDLYLAGVLPQYVRASQMEIPGNILRLATAGVSYEFVTPGTRPSEFPFVLIMLHREGVEHRYAKLLLDAGYTVENTIEAWRAGLPPEFALAVS